MGVLWLSGRSGLMLTMFGVLAGIGFLRGRMVWATLATLAAAFSKEEGAMLPVLFTLWAVIASSNDGVSDDALTITQRVVAASRRTWPIWAAVAVVLASRIAAGGFFPTNAPDFYTPVFGPLRLLRNVLEYADRWLTFAAAAVLLTWLWTRHRPQPTAHDRYVLRMAAVWFICGFALNVFLPVRSSLYAMFPGVGSALAAATCIGMFTRTLDSRSRQRLAWAGVVLLAMLSPVYLTRNVRWTELARLSASVVAQIRRAEPYLPNGSTLVIADDITTRANLRNAWAGPVYEVAAMEFGNRLTLIVPAPDAEPCCPDAVHVTLRDGALHGLPSLR